MVFIVPLLQLLSPIATRLTKAVTSGCLLDQKPPWPHIPYIYTPLPVPTATCHLASAPELTGYNSQHVTTAVRLSTYSLSMSSVSSVRQLCHASAHWESLPMPLSLPAGTWLIPCHPASGSPFYSSLIFSWNWSDYLPSS